MNRLATTAALLLAALCTVPAQAATITFTGNESDFTTQGVSPIQDDGIDTEAFCGGNPLDIGKVYVTNDATNLYIGMQYSTSASATSTSRGPSTPVPAARSPIRSAAPSTGRPPRARPTSTSMT